MSKILIDARKCSRCDGLGWYRIGLDEIRCQDCDGTGTLMNWRSDVAPPHFEWEGRGDAHYLVKYNDDGQPAAVAIALNWLDCSLMPGFVVVEFSEYVHARSVVLAEGNRLENERKRETHDQQ